MFQHNELQRFRSGFQTKGAVNQEVVFSCGWSGSRCTARGKPIVRSSDMYVGQEVQAGTIRLQAQPNQLLHSTAHLTPRRRYGRQFHCRPSRLRTQPLHAASDLRVGHQVPPLHILSCSGCPTRAARSGSAAFARIEQSLFTTVLHNGSEHVPLRAELSIASVKDRPPATSSTARAAASVIVAAARAARAHQRPWFARQHQAVVGYLVARREAAVTRLECVPGREHPLALHARRRVCHGVAMCSRLAYSGAVEDLQQRAAQARFASRVDARARRSSVGSRLRAVGERAGSEAEVTSIECSRARTGHRSRVATRV